MRSLNSRPITGSRGQDASEQYHFGKVTTKRPSELPDDYRVFLEHIGEVNATISAYLSVNVPQFIRAASVVGDDFRDVFYPHAHQSHPMQMRRLVATPFNDAAIDACLTTIQQTTRRRFRPLEARLQEFDNLVTIMRSRQIRILLRIRALDPDRRILPTGSAAAGTPCDASTDVDLVFSGAYDDNLRIAMKREFGSCFRLRSKPVLCVKNYRYQVDLAFCGDDTTSPDLAMLIRNESETIRLMMANVKSVMKMVGIIDTCHFFLSSVSVCISVLTWHRHVASPDESEPIQNFFRWFSEIDFQTYGISLTACLYRKRSNHAIEVEHPFDTSVYVANAVSNMNVPTIVQWVQILSKIPKMECFL